jgi:ribosomal protein S18 acetylase RimI-like enzyme
MTDDLLTPPDAPEISGLTFRRFRGEADFPGIVAVYAACRPADGDQWPWTVEDAARDFAHLSRSDPSQDMIFAEIDGEMIGYGQSGWYSESDGTTLHTLNIRVTPGWRRRGIEQAIIRWLEERQRDVAAGQAEQGPHFFQGEWFDDAHDAIDLLLSEGYAVVRRWYEMTRPLDGEIPDAPLPEGLEVRPATPDQYRQIWDADLEAFRDHWGFGELTEEDYQRWINDPVVMTPELWQIAWDGDQIAGQVRSFINHKENADNGRLRGYTEFISVRRPWRRRGLAKGLILRSLRILQERGMTEAALGVDTENTSGALRLYESCGFRPTRSGAMYRKPLQQ